MAFFIDSRVTLLFLAHPEPLEGGVHGNDNDVCPVNGFVLSTAPSTIVKGTGNN